MCLSVFANVLRVCVRVWVRGGAVSSRLVSSDLALACTRTTHSPRASPLPARTVTCSLLLSSSRVSLLLLGVEGVSGGGGGVSAGAVVVAGGRGVSGGRGG